ncbi:MAG: phasin family protein [Acidobacteria bacterium]|nr:phasin family protein [Acidobacteriota bacterium]
MATKAKTEEKKTTVSSMAKDLWLATLGAFSLAEEEVNRFVKKLVDRGSLSQEEGKKLVADLRTKVKKNRLDFGKIIEENVSKALEKLNIPSKEEIHDLTRKVDELAKKIDTFGTKVA